MTTPAIEVHGIGKLYRLEHMGAGSRTFRDLLTDMASAPLRRLRRIQGSDESLEDFWALKDISFNVQPGEVMGIIGRNGAGKSTLLKILSRIVEPTTGEATMRGRVASLLEVGTGFHPELSGRENVYLNGSILGMKKREMDARFDEIVAFAEVEKFLDTPVKRYSSGMYVRLAFAVAAHLDPEILIVDEVLAVGDAEFQKKCLGKMKEVSSGGGRTVLFVSHNMTAVRALCSSGVWLRDGAVALSGTADAVVDAYLGASSHAASGTVELKRPRNASIWMNRALVLRNGEPSSVVPMGSELAIAVNFESKMPTQHPRFGYLLQTPEGEKILNGNNSYQESPQFSAPVLTGSIMCDLGRVPLMPGNYTLSLWMGDIYTAQHVELEAIAFEVAERDVWGTGLNPPPGSHLWWPSNFRFSETLF
jgi:lipopolysaccharide transport system ATP-binding protein